ncbi:MULTISPECIES: hypothetical protein [unclassified Brucella]|uniref:hypothetical protein n=1 Tax=unclassified Brucella TaxID=2632610 RepID=UPI000972A590|nr:MULTISPECIES: hypothetical protein [unclassified Brucella]APX70367.1 hypothetical protein BKD03_14285 [Brucella sp. 09RB8471]MRN79565.1 hypothetical protein [Brucella sp. 10RB9210]
MLACARVIITSLWKRKAEGEYFDLVDRYAIGNIMRKRQGGIPLCDILAWNRSSFHWQVFYVL